MTTCKFLSANGLIIVNFNNRSFKYGLLNSALQHLESLPFVAPELDLKEQRLREEQIEKLKDKITITVGRSKGEEEAEVAEEEDDDEFKLEEKPEL